MTDLLGHDHAAPTVEEVTSPPTTRIVFDTSVLVADPHCVQAYADQAIVIPLTVIEELDGLKTRPDDVGRAARTALRTIEDLRVEHGGSLADPVPLNGGTLQIEINGIQKPLLVEHGLDPAVPDNRIIGAALGQRNHGPTTIISNDAALRIKAAHLGVGAAAHEPARARSERPSGWRVLDVGWEVVDGLYAANAVEAEALGADADLVSENEFAVVRSGSQSALARRRGDDLRLLAHATPEPWGLHPRNKEQRFALELSARP